MKKHIFFVLLISIIVCSTAFASDNIAVFKIGQGKYNVNGLIKEDAAPYIKNNRTYLPLRYVAYSMGIGDNSIAWDNDSKTAYLSRQGEIMSVRVGESRIKVGERTIITDAPAEIHMDRVMLPIRAVAEAFGCRVDWDPAGQRVIISVN